MGIKQKLSLKPQSCVLWAIFRIQLPDALSVSEACVRRWLLRRVWNVASAMQDCKCEKHTTENAASSVTTMKIEWNARSLGHAMVEVNDGDVVRWQVSYVTWQATNWWLCVLWAAWRTKRSTTYQFFGLSFFLMLMIDGKNRAPLRRHWVVMFERQ